MYVMVDVEADGPIPGDYSMVSFGAVVVSEWLQTSFYSGPIKPISEKWSPETLAISGHTREELLNGKDPLAVMSDFETWITRNIPKRPIFISDNNGFDWSFINWYFHHFLGRNPFGFSSQNLNSLYKGMQRDYYASFKHLRKTKHTHHPVDDAKGNAEALLVMMKEFKGRTS
jgi:DNA polymerase III alpha subunit (gram-positive type)